MLLILSGPNGGQFQILPIRTSARSPVRRRCPGAAQTCIQSASALPCVLCRIQPRRLDLSRQLLLLAVRADVVLAHNDIDVFVVEVLLFFRNQTLRLGLYVRQV